MAIAFHPPPTNLRVVMYDPCSRVFAEFNLARLRKTVFEPKAGQRIGILIDWADPKQIEGFVFLKDAALTAAAIATFPGYLRAGVGVSPFVLLAIGALACWLLVRFRGERVKSSAPPWPKRHPLPA